MSDRKGVALVWPVAANTGGVELIARETLEHFSGRRPTTFVGTSMTPPVEGVRHVRVEPKLGNVRRPVAFRRDSQRALQELDPGDAVISMGANCAPGGVRWVHSVHGAFLRVPGRLQVGPMQVSARWRHALPRHQVLLALERNYFQRHPPRMVLATSERECEDLVELYDVDPDAVHVIGNGYNPALFNNQHRVQVRDEVRGRLGIPDGRLCVLFAANELHRKGFATLLAALARLRREDVRVDVVGKADPAPLVAAAEARGWVPQVYWHGSSPWIADFYAAGDLLVLPTCYEPFGLVLVEALATGLPVVTTRLAGASPYVTPECGRLIERPDDDEELAAVLDGCLEASVLARMSRAAPAAVRELEWSAVLNRVEDLVLRD